MTNTLDFTLNCFEHVILFALVVSLVLVVFLIESYVYCYYDVNDHSILCLRGVEVAF